MLRGKFLDIVGHRAKGLGLGGKVEFTVPLAVI